MKTSQYLIVAGFAMSSLVACQDSSVRDEQIAADVDNYIDSVSTNISNYSKETWDEISSSYQSKKAELKAEGRELSAKAKAELDEAEQKFVSLKSKFDSNIEAANAKKAMRDELFGSGKLGSDLSFSWVTAANAKEVYVNFVSAVDKNKDRYTREDWDEIKMLYEALDNRKNAIEKDLPGPDNREIAKQKLKFVAIKAVNRLTAKVEENTDSKK